MVRGTDTYSNCQRCLGAGKLYFRCQMVVSTTTNYTHTYVCPQCSGTGIFKWDEMRWEIKPEGTQI
jgi:Zn finger protein HypA/HybF involved in hydrogenase expression